MASAQDQDGHTGTRDRYGSNLIRSPSHTLRTRRWPPRVQPSRSPIEQSAKMKFLAESDYSEVVSAESLERQLKLVRIAAVGLLSGVFGPRLVPRPAERERA